MLGILYYDLWVATVIPIVHVHDDVNVQRFREPIVTVSASIFRACTVYLLYYY